MMVYILKTEAGREIHAAPVTHPNAIDWVKCKDSEEAQAVIDYWNSHKSMGVRVSVQSALDSVQYLKQNKYDTNNYKHVNFKIYKDGHIYISKEPNL